jgi:HEAT repeat protein
MTTPKENNMLYQRFKTWTVVMAFMLSGLLSAATRAQSTTAESYAVLERQLTEAIANVRTGAAPETRADAAEHLADLTSGIVDTRVDAKTLADMVALLDTPEDPVRLWVAVSLGNLGYSARTAIPKLQELLPEADCLQGNLTLADAIRYALARMDAAVPPPTCGRAEAKEVLFKKLLTKAVAKAGEGEILDFRTNAAKHLGKLARWIGPDKVDDQAVAELVSLLNTSTDIPVRSFVIGALGSLGTRAKSAIPDLQKILAAEDCAKEPSMAISIEDQARAALLGMGITHPPSPCGRPYMNFGKPNAR